MGIPKEELPKFKAGAGAYHVAVVFEPGDGGWFSWVMVKDGITIALQDAEQHVPCPWMIRDQRVDQRLVVWTEDGCRVLAIKSLSKEEWAMVMFTIKDNPDATPFKVKEENMGKTIWDRVWF